MKTITLMAVFMLEIMQCYAGEGNYLNRAILTLPPKYLANIDLSQRTEFLLDFSYEPSDNRLDYENGYLDFHTDVSYDRRYTASCAFMMKLLKRKNDTPLVFVHMEKTDEKIEKESTFILDILSDGKWHDVTKAYMPATINLMWYFEPLRNKDIIEVGPYVRLKGEKEYGTEKKPRLEIKWEGERFTLSESKSETYNQDWK